MNIQDAFVSQYAAGLIMIENTISACHEELWNNTRDKNKFWRIAYHALFYTDLYLSTTEKDFAPWTQHHDDYEVLGDTVPWLPHHAPRIGEPYTKKELLEYCASLKTRLTERLKSLDFEGSSDFFWLPFNKFEVHIYNIRHLQHHTGQLIDRIRERHGTAIEWISKGTA